MWIRLVFVIWLIFHRFLDSDYSVSRIIHILVISYHWYIKQASFKGCPMHTKHLTSWYLRSKCCDTFLWKKVELFKLGLIICIWSFCQSFNFTFICVAWSSLSLVSKIMINIIFIWWWTWLSAWFSSFTLVMVLHFLFGLGRQHPRWGLCCLQPS